MQHNLQIFWVQNELHNWEDPWCKSWGEGGVHEPRKVGWLPSHFCNQSCRLALQLWEALSYRWNRQGLTSGSGNMRTHRQRAQHFDIFNICFQGRGNAPVKCPFLSMTIRKLRVPGWCTEHSQHCHRNPYQMSMETRPSQASTVPAHYSKRLHTACQMKEPS